MLGGDGLVTLESGNQACLEFLRVLKREEMGYTVLDGALTGLGDTYQDAVPGYDKLLFLALYQDPG